MKKINNDQDKSIFSGVMLAYLVLLLHVLLMIILGIVVVVIKGIYDFRWLILAGGLVLLGASAYYFYHRFQADRQKISDLMKDPALRDRTLEISLMGGLASVKLGHRDTDQPLIASTSEPMKQLAAPTLSQVGELTTLNSMFEKGLITREEFETFKKELLSNQQSLPPE